MLERMGRMSRLKESGAAATLIAKEAVVKMAIARRIWDMLGCRRWNVERLQRAKRLVDKGGGGFGRTTLEAA